MITSLENDACFLSIESYGGAIADFHLKDKAQINPLSFAFTKQQMPENNKNGAPYRGHFLCAGRWGLPSAGEIKKEIPNHGEAANIEWEINKEHNEVLMQTLALKEGLQVDRKIELDNALSLFSVSESFTNVNALGRLFNVVQHPSLAAPFLDASTVINCNGTVGFDQSLYQTAEKNSCRFPFVKDDKGIDFNLSQSTGNYSSVFSFIVDTNNNIGWVTAYSPVYNLLFGYIWKRSDYPWIHLWQHFGDDKILYRGIEFGTAGIHQPFGEILNTATHLFGEKTLAYIDAGEIISKKYLCFICKTGSNFAEVKNITIANDCITINAKENNTIELVTSMNFIHELSK